jgi:hypothetical protein
VRTAISWKVIWFGDTIIPACRTLSASIVWQTASVVGRRRTVTDLLHTPVDAGGLVISCGRQRFFHGYRHFRNHLGEIAGPAKRLR